MPSPNRVLFVLLLAGVSFALSQTLVVPALPQISEEFSAGASSTSWVLTSFLLSASVATPAACSRSRSGSCATRSRRRRSRPASA